MFLLAIALLGCPGNPEHYLPHLITETSDLVVAEAGEAVHVEGVVTAPHSLALFDGDVAVADPLHDLHQRRVRLYGTLFDGQFHSEADVLLLPADANTTQFHARSATEVGFVGMLGPSGLKPYTLAIDANTLTLRHTEGEVALAENAQTIDDVRLVHTDSDADLELAVRWTHTDGTSQWTVWDSDPAWTRQSLDLGEARTRDEIAQAVGRVSAAVSLSPSALYRAEPSHPESHEFRLHRTLYLEMALPHSMGQLDAVRGTLKPDHRDATLAQILRGHSLLGRTRPELEALLGPADTLHTEPQQSGLDLEKARDHAHWSWGLPDGRWFTVTFDAAGRADNQFVHHDASDWGHPTALNGTLTRLETPAWGGEEAVVRTEYGLIRVLPRTPEQADAITHHIGRPVRLHGSLQRVRDFERFATPDADWTADTLPVGLHFTVDRIAPGLEVSTRARRGPDASNLQDARRLLDLPYTPLFGTVRVHDGKAILHTAAGDVAISVVPDAWESIEALDGQSARVEGELTLVNTVAAPGAPTFSVAAKRWYAL